MCVCVYQYNKKEDKTIITINQPTKNPTTFPQVLTKHIDYLSVINWHVEKIRVLDTIPR